MRDLGHFPKSSADHVLAFRPCPRIGLALVAVFAIAAVILSFLFVTLPRMQEAALVNQEQILWVR